MYTWAPFLQAPWPTVLHPTSPAVSYGPMAKCVTHHTRTCCLTQYAQRTLTELIQNQITAKGIHRSQGGCIAYEMPRVSVFPPEGHIVAMWPAKSDSDLFTR